MSILFNPAAVTALNGFNRANNQMASTMQRLSSGLRINGAKDDKFI